MTGSGVQPDTGSPTKGSEQMRPAWSQMTVALLRPAASGEGRACGAEEALDSARGARHSGRHAGRATS